MKKKILALVTGLFLCTGLFAQYRIVKVNNLEELKVRKGEKIILVQTIYEQRANVGLGKLDVAYFYVILESEDANDN